MSVKSTSVLLKGWQIRELFAADYFFYIRRDLHLGNISEQILLEKQLDLQQDSRWSANHFVRTYDGETSGFFFKGIRMALLSRQRWVFLLSSKALNVLPSMLSCFTSTVWNIDYFIFFPSTNKVYLGRWMECIRRARLLWSHSSAVHESNSGLTGEWQDCTVSSISILSSHLKRANISPWHVSGFLLKKINIISLFISVYILLMNSWGFLLPREV